MAPDGKGRSRMGRISRARLLEGRGDLFPGLSVMRERSLQAQELVHLCRRRSEDVWATARLRQAQDVDPPVDDG